MSKVLTDYVTRPYQQVWDDYVDKSNMEAQLFNDRIEAVEMKSSVLELKWMEKHYFSIKTAFYRGTYFYLLNNLYYF